MDVVKLVEWVPSATNLFMVLGVLAGVLLMARAVRSLTRGRGDAASAAGAGKRRLKLDDVTSRWQLLLLGSAAFLVSIASGYRVWEGMTNFTGERVMSLLITFGVQGVMLISAWLIGESFATGMSQRSADGRRIGRLDPLIGAALAVLVVGCVFYFILHNTDAVGVTRGGTFKPVDWARFADVAAYFALGLIVLGVLMFNFSRGGELSQPYVQGLRIVVKNAVLWVMFLACMASAVFFSFDSLFTAIFPKEERARAAQLRAQNQVAGMVADIGSTIERRRVEEVGHLFQSKGWLGYDTHLTRLAQVAQTSSRDIEAYFTGLIEDKNRAIKQQQERIATAQSGSAGLASKKGTLTDELARLKGERPALATDYAEKKSELDTRARGLDAKRVEAQAEERGAEGTLKQGRGPIYRQLMGELARLQDAYKIQDERVRDAQKRLVATDTRIAQIERELAAVDGDLAKLKAEAETAEQRIKLATDQSQGDDQPRIDPTRVLPAFERARLEFRQEPTKEKLASLSQQCSQLNGAMLATNATREKVRGIECDPKQAAEAANVMFALNDGLKTFDSTCSGGDKLEAQKTTDALYSFARKCLADSGLPAKETDDLRGRINFLELTRDDKSHPFVASLNAFQDGNRLAYLALAIAIGMESLVFMAGLFGANAVRSPLSDVPSTKARSGRHLEDIVQNALLPDTFENARLVLNAMRPMTPRDGFSSRVRLREDDPHAPDIRRVLNAAATIGAVRHVDDHDEIYEVRSELFEFLSVVSKRAFEASDEHARNAELRKVVTVALQPHIGDHADVVLHHCRPMAEDQGYSATVHLLEMSADDAFVTQKVLNAGATLGYVQAVRVEDRSFFVHKQLYKTLLMISAAAPRTGQRSRAPQLEGPGMRADAGFGGDLTRRAPQVAGPPQAAALPEPEPYEPDAGIAPPPGEAGPADESALQREWQNYFTASLVRAVGVRPDQYIDISGETFSAALAAAEAFKIAQRAHPTLHSLVEEKLRTAQDAVDMAHAHLDSTPEAQTGIGRAAIKHAYGDVSCNLMIIALLPGGPIETLLKSIIADLEAAYQTDSGKLDVEQENLLRLSKRLVSHLTRNDRNSEHEWRRMQAGFEASPVGGPPIAFIARRAQRPGSA